MSVGLATRGYISPIVRVFEGQISEVSVTVDSGEVTADVEVDPELEVTVVVNDCTT
jgi:hypothetical protein